MGDSKVEVLDVQSKLCSSERSWELEFPLNSMTLLGAEFMVSVSQPFLPILHFLICLIRRSCLASFSIFFRGKFLKCSYTLVASMGGRVLGASYVAILINSPNVSYF